MKRLIYVIVLSFLAVNASYALGFDMMPTESNDVQVTYSSNQQSILINLDTYSSARLEIFNILGSHVMVANIPYTISKVDVSRLPEGQYILKLTATNGKLLSMKKFAVY